MKYVNDYKRYFNIGYILAKLLICPSSVSFSQLVYAWIRVDKDSCAYKIFRKVIINRVIK